MAIRLEKEYHLEMDQEEVWSAIQNPNILAEILPNCTALEPLGNNKYTAHIDVKIGPVHSKFRSTLEMYDMQELDGYKFRVQGNGKKGSMNGQGEIKLFSNGRGTGFTFIAKGNVTGIIARVGQRLIEAAGKKLMDQGFENFKNRVMGSAAA
ncbi:MAG: carbon monoxide dehydrogenase subunit G [Candidatus Neomarinimicrobiota bacterium]|nr:carbon monoxide dehydrogenase subunit G [Candidatus Neomarinimicrobiota bacterium]